MLKVGHHGRSDSTSEEFLDTVDPAIAVISADNADDAVLDRIDAKGVTTYTTYDDGTVVLSLNAAQTSYASPTPTVAEYPVIVAVPVVMAAVLAAVLLCKKQFKQRSCA